MARTVRRSLLRDDRGVVAITVGLSLPVLVGFLGLGAESGYVYFEQRRLQASADVAAYAGAVVARAGGDLAAVSAAAGAESEALAFDPARGSIAVRQPPLSGAHMNARSVEVVLTQSYPRLVSGLFASGDYAVSVRAVAGFDQPGPACIIALDETASDALSFSGSADATFADCELMANSLAEDAVSVTGSAAVAATCVGSAGGVEVSAELELTGCPEPRVHMARAKDPYAHLTAPPPGEKRTLPKKGPMTLSPGQYDSMNLKGQVTLEPGVYSVESLTINANASIVGEGVTIYIRDSEKADLTINGSAAVDLSAPTSGDTRGVLIYASPSNESLSPKFNGTADSSLRDAIYMPGQAVELRGDFSGSGGCTRIVANAVSVQGNPSFGNDCAGAGVEAVTLPGSVRLLE